MERVPVAGGTQVADALARACGLEAGFGRGTSGRDVAGFLVRRPRALEAGSGRPPGLHAGYLPVM